MGDRSFTVSRGGLFHIPKVKYSPETEALIRELIRESKLSIFQRKEVEKSVKNGEPLPLPPTKTPQRGKKKVEDLQVRYIFPRRRKLNSIQQSGAFERDTFVPSYAKANYDTEKKKLQEVMAFGRTLKSGKPKRKALNLNDDDISESDKTEETSKDKILHEIMEEIEDKRKFLRRMEELGQGKKYKDIIGQEIAAKFRLMDNVTETFKELDLKNEKAEKTSLF